MRPLGHSRCDAEQLIPLLRRDRSCGNQYSSALSGSTNSQNAFFACKQTLMSGTAGCFDFLRGRRSLNKRDEVAAPLEVQQSRRHHGGGEVVSNLAYIAGCFSPFVTASRPLLFEQLRLWHQRRTSAIAVVGCTTFVLSIRNPHCSRPGCD